LYQARRLLRLLCTALPAWAVMIEPGNATRTATQFVLRPASPDIYVTDQDGRDRYFVRSRVAERIGLWSLRDLAGNELVSVRQDETWPLPSYSVWRGGERVAMVREGPGPATGRWRAAIRTVVAGTPARLRYVVEAPGAERLEVAADPGAVEYQLTRAGSPAATVATVGLRWLSWAATFGLGVSVADGEDAPLVLAVAAMIESAWGRL
jgi:uncharacterized protein YxjI